MQEAIIMAVILPLTATAFLVNGTDYWTVWTDIQLPAFITDVTAPKWTDEELAEIQAIKERRQVWDDERQRECEWAKATDTFHAGCNPDGWMEIKEYDICDKYGKEAGWSHCQ